MNRSVTIEELNAEEVKLLTPLLVFLGIIASTGIPGNIIVCLVYRVTSKNSVSRFFIWWLAVIDIISCFVLFLEIVNVVKQFTYTNTWLCKFTIFFTIWPVITSGFGLCLISIDRFLRVCKPLKKQISQKRAKLMCLATVFIALAFSWPSLILFGTYTKEFSDHNLTSSTCTIQNEYQGTTYALIYNGFLWILFVSVLIFLGVFYAMIGKKIFTQLGRRISTSSICDQSKGNDNVSGDDITTDTSFVAVKSRQNLFREHSTISRKMSTVSTGTKLRLTSQRQAKARKSALVMFLISFVFVVSFLPYLILRMKEAFDATFVQSMSNIGRACYKFFLRTYFLNCAINPFIYCAFAATFRQEVRAHFRRLFSKLR
jgi:hypothetical protein